MTEEDKSRVNGNRLVIGGTISAQATQIQQMVKELLTSGSAEVEIDLTSVSNIRSADLAVIASSVAAAQKRNRKVRILAAKATARILRFGGLDRIAEIVEEAE